MAIERDEFVLLLAAAMLRGNVLDSVLFVLALHQASDVLRAELRSEMAQLAVELRSEMKQLSVELRGEMTNLAAALRVEMAQQIGELRREIGGVARQMYVALLGQTAVLLAFFYFIVLELR